MTMVRLASETDFAGWRAAARVLRAAGIAAEDVVWTVEQGAELVRPLPPGGRQPCFTVPRAFLELAEAVVLHRSDERFGLLYRLLLRLPGEPGLLRGASDPEAARARLLARQVDQAAQKMKAFLRFRPVTDAEGREAYAAWFEPDQRVTEHVAAFFARRFAQRRFSILTPDVCAHWDTGGLVFTPGADPADAPRAEGLEDFWRARCAAGLVAAQPGPARPEAPQRYWRNLPEGRLIPELIARAEAQFEQLAEQAAQQMAEQMARHAPPEPSRRVVRAAQRASRDAPFDGHAPASLEEIVAGVQLCRRCDLWRHATQGVAGEGPGRARLMFVGEQPGDQEDLAGAPFVGPAGQVLDKALAEAGLPRAETYVTNAVKHFKHELRGKRRLHKTPDAGEVSACRSWLDGERRLVRPRVIVALGATAALSVFGKPLPVGRFRQQAIQLPDQAQGVVTYHPSYLLRVPDAEAKAKAYAMFVDDLRFAWRLAG